MSNPQRALGTQLKIGSASAATAVAGLTSIGGLSLSADTIDVTTLDATSGYRTFIAGFKDSGDVPLEGFYLMGGDGGQTNLHTLYESGDETDFTIVFPISTGCQWAFKGIVTAYGTAAALADAISFSCTIKVSGKPILTSTGG